VDVQIKICGITSPEMAVACLEAGADMIGLVHYPASPRHVDVPKIHEILNAIEPFGGRSVLVVVDQLPDKIDPRIELIHVYGDIQNDEQNHGDIPDKMFVVKDFSTFARLLESKDESSSCDYCLEMSKGNLPGGNGAVWDWSIARPFCEHYKTFIAGGITPENVADVIRLAKPFGIDVSSGVESSPGIKDIDKVKRLIENVHYTIIEGTR
jgi:phosphoribosylanthranilate isomerase